MRIFSPSLRRVKVSSMPVPDSNLRQGAPSGPGSVDVGAVIFPPQIEIVDDHVQDAVAKGAKVVVGGPMIDR